MGHGRSVLVVADRPLGAIARGQNEFGPDIPNDDLEPEDAPSPNIPVKDFWSLLVYDPQTRSMLQTDQQFPSLSRQREGILVDSDTSVDVCFGPQPPAGKEANWVQTIPGKGWFVVLRLYGPLEPWFDKTWRPREIELVD